MTRKNIFGYRFAAFSSLAIAVFGFLVWGHHMFVSTQSVYAGLVFSFLVMVVILSAVKVFNWTATLYKSSISHNTPMLYGLGLSGFSSRGMTVVSRRWEWTCMFTTPTSSLLTFITSWWAER
jgi:heme/copper-type cytochrome/quinol oxidase subunit 1